MKIKIEIKILTQATTRNEDTAKLFPNTRKLSDWNGNPLWDIVGDFEELVSIAKSKGITDNWIVYEDDGRRRHYHLKHDISICERRVIRKY